MLTNEEGIMTVKLWGVDWLIYIVIILFWIQFIVFFSAFLFKMFISLFVLFMKRTHIQVV